MPAETPPAPPKLSRCPRSNARASQQSRAATPLGSHRPRRCAIRRRPNDTHARAWRRPSRRSLTAALAIAQQEVPRAPRPDEVCHERDGPPPTSHMTASATPARMRSSRSKYPNGGGGEGPTAGRLPDGQSRPTSWPRRSRRGSSGRFTRATAAVVRETLACFRRPCRGRTLRCPVQGESHGQQQHPGETSARPERRRSRR